MMALPKKGRRSLVVDDQRYCVFVSGRRLDDDGDVPIGFVAHLDGNDNSKLAVQGITSRGYWYDYPYAEQFLDRYLSVTPRGMVAVIRHAIGSGWDPTGSAQFRIELTNESFRNIVSADAAPRES